MFFHGLGWYMLSHSLYLTALLVCRDPKITCTHSCNIWIYSVSTGSWSSYIFMCIIRKPEKTPLYFHFDYLPFVMTWYIRYILVSNIVRQYIFYSIFYLNSEFCLRNSKWHYVLSWHSAFLCTSLHVFFFLEKTSIILFMPILCLGRKGLIYSIYSMWVEIMS